MQQGTVQRDIALSRIEIDQTRLLVLRAASTIDAVGSKAAAKDIAMIRLAAPQMAGQVLDRCMQVFGGAGLHNDVPLAAMFAKSRVGRLGYALNLAYIAKGGSHD
jgi:alkylation response protein AidB-like acyl-CoA dehydrogenase